MPPTEDKAQKNASPNKQDSRARSSSKRAVEPPTPPRAPRTAQASPRAGKGRQASTPSTKGGAADGATTVPKEPRRPPTVEGSSSSSPAAAAGKSGAGARLMHGAVPLPSGFGSNPGLVTAKALDATTGEVIRDATLTIGCRLNADDERYTSVASVHPNQEGVLEADAPPRHFPSIVRINAPGFAGDSRRLKHSEEGYQVGDVELIPHPCDVQADVVDGATSRPLVGIQLNFTEGPEDVAATSTEDGQACATVLPGNYTLTVSSVSTVPVTRAVEVPRRTPTLELGTLRLKVRPVPTRIRLEGWAEALLPSTSDEAGDDDTAAALPDGTQLTFTSGKNRTVPAPLDLQSGEADVELSPLETYTAVLAIPGFYPKTLKSNVKAAVPADDGSPESEAGKAVLALPCSGLRLITIPVPCLFVDARRDTTITGVAGMQLTAEGLLARVAAAADAETGRLVIDLPNCEMRLSCEHASYSDAATKSWKPPFDLEKKQTPSSAKQARAEIDAMSDEEFHQEAVRIPVSLAAPRVCGTVKASGRSPVAGTIVKLTPVATEADKAATTSSSSKSTAAVTLKTSVAKDGRVSGRVYPGDYDVVIAAPGCASVTKQVTVPSQDPQAAPAATNDDGGDDKGNDAAPAPAEEETDLLSAELQPFVRKATVVVKDIDGSPVAGATVRVTDVFGTEDHKTDAQGVVRQDVSGSASLVITTTKDDPAVSATLAPPTTNADVTVTAVVGAGGGIDVSHAHSNDGDESAPRRSCQLLVLSPTQEPVPAATVTVKSGHEKVQTTTDSVGSAVVVVGGSTNITAKHPKYGRLTCNPRAPRTSDKGVVVLAYGDPNLNPFGIAGEVLDVPRGSVRVRVVDCKTGAPVERASVRIGDGAATRDVHTDADGHAKADKLVLWAVTATVTAPGFDSRTVRNPVDSRAFKPKVRDLGAFELERELGGLAGTITVDGASLVEGAAVAISSEPTDDDAPEETKLVVPQGGRSEFAVKLYPGRYVVKCEVPGCEAISKPCDVQGGQSPTKLTLPCAAIARQVQVAVKDAATKQPLADVPASLTVESRAGSKTLDVPKTGSVLVNVKGQTRLCVKADGYADEVFKPSMTSDKPLSVTLVMKSSTPRIHFDKPPHSAEQNPDANQTVFALDEDATKEFGQVHDASVVNGAPYYVAPKGKPQHRVARLAGKARAVGVQPHTGSAASRFRAVHRPEGSFALLLAEEPGLALAVAGLTGLRMVETDNASRDQWFRIMPDKADGNEAGDGQVVQIVSVTTSKALSTSPTAPHGLRLTELADENEAGDEESSTAQRFVLLDADAVLTDGAVVAIIPREAATQRVGVNARSSTASADEVGAADMLQSLVARRNSADGGWFFEVHGADGKRLTVGAAAGTPLCAAPSDDADAAARQVFDVLTTDDGYTMLQSRVTGQFVSCGRDGKAGLAVVAAQGRRAPWQQFEVKPSSVDVPDGATVQFESLVAPAGRQLAVTAAASGAPSRVVLAEAGTSADADGGRQTFRRLAAGPGCWRLVPESDAGLALTAASGNSLTVEKLDENRKAQVFALERVSDDGPTVRLISMKEPTGKASVTVATDSSSGAVTLKPTDSTAKAQTYRLIVQTAQRQDDADESSASSPPKGVPPADCASHALEFRILSAVNAGHGLGLPNISGAGTVELTPTPRTNGLVFKALANPAGGFLFSLPRGRVLVSSDRKPHQLKVAPASRATVNEYVLHCEPRGTSNAFVLRDATGRRAVSSSDAADGKQGIRFAPSSGGGDEHTFVCVPTLPAHKGHYALAPRHGDTDARVAVRDDGTITSRGSIDNMTIFEAIRRPEGGWGLAPVAGPGSSKDGALRLQTGAAPDDAATIGKADASADAQALTVEDVEDGVVRVKSANRFELMVSPEDGTLVTRRQPKTKKDADDDDGDAAAKEAEEDESRLGFRIIAVPKDQAENDGSRRDASSANTSSKGGSDNDQATLTPGACVMLVPRVARDKRVSCDPATGRVHLDAPLGDSSVQRFRLEKSQDGEAWHLAPATRVGQRVTATTQRRDEDGENKQTTVVGLRGARAAPADGPQRFTIREFPDEGSVALVLSGGQHVVEVSADADGGTDLAVVHLDQGSPRRRGRAKAKAPPPLPPDAARFEIHRAHTDTDLEDGASYYLAPAKTPLKRLSVSPAEEVLVSNACGTRGERFTARRRPRGTWALEPQAISNGRVLSVRSAQEGLALQPDDPYSDSQRFQVRDAPRQPGAKLFISCSHEDDDAPFGVSISGEAASVVAADAATPLVTQRVIVDEPGTAEHGGVYRVMPTKAPNLRLTLRTAGDDNSGAGSIVAEAPRNDNGPDASQQHFLLQQVASSGRWLLRPASHVTQAVTVVAAEGAEASASSSSLGIADADTGRDDQQFAVEMAPGGSCVLRTSNGGVVDVIVDGDQGHVRVTPPADDGAPGDDTTADSEFTLEPVEGTLLDGNAYHIVPVANDSARLIAPPRRAPMRFTTASGAPPTGATDKFVLARCWNANPEDWTITPVDRVRRRRHLVATACVLQPAASNDAPGDAFRLVPGAAATDGRPTPFKLQFAGGAKQVRTRGASSITNDSQPEVGQVDDTDTFTFVPTTSPSTDDADDTVNHQPSDLIDGAIYELYPRSNPNARWEVAAPHGIGSPIDIVPQRTGGLEQKFRARRRPDGRWSFVPLARPEAPPPPEQEEEAVAAEPKPAEDAKADDDTTSTAAVPDACIERESPAGVVVRPSDDARDAQAFDVGPLSGNPPQGPIRLPSNDNGAGGKELTVRPGTGDDGGDASGEAEAAVGSLRIPVRNARTNLPLAGCKVELNDSVKTQNQTTGEDGVVSFTDVMLWDCAVTVTHPSCDPLPIVAIPASRAAKDDSGAVTAGRIDLTPTSITVQGATLSNLAGSVAIANAQIKFKSMPSAPKEPSFTEVCTSDTDGAFTVSLIPGRYELTIEADECQKYRRDDVVVKTPADLGGRKTMPLDPIKLEVNTVKCAGLVIQAESGKPLAGARVEFKSPFSTPIVLTTGADGKFDQARAPPQSTISIAADHQAPASLAMPSSAAERENIRVNLDGIPCVVKGFVRDGTSSSVRAISGATVTCGSITVTTGSDGRYTITLPQGDRTLEFTGGGCYPTSYPLSLTGDNVTQDAFMCPKLASTMAFRFILRWNETPADLDMHMRAASGPQTIYWSSKTVAGIGANLDCDVTNGCGPETITVTDKKQHLMLSIHNFSGTPGWDKAGACVDVYTDEGHQQTIKCDLTSGSAASEYWYVCDTVDGKVILKNKLVGTKP